MPSIRIGARGSALAMWQAERVKFLLSQAHPEIDSDIVQISTSGDQDRNTPLAEMGGAGIFVKELENALRDSRIDLAVHSAKDLPSALPDGYMLSSVLERGYAEDALICRQDYHLDNLPEGCTVATGSPRRRAFLKHYRPDLNFCEVRGNVDTRLRKLREGQFDAIVLALAGLSRLRIPNVKSEILLSDKMLPAPGQGFIAVETMAASGQINEIAGSIDNHISHVCLEAERSMMRTLQAGCSSAVGGYCRYQKKEGNLTMTAAVADLQGKKVIRSEESLEYADGGGTFERGSEIGRRLGQKLLDEGAGDLL